MNKKLSFTDSLSPSVLVNIMYFSETKDEAKMNDFSSRNMDVGKGTLVN